MSFRALAACVVLMLLGACRSGSPPTGITVLIESPPDSLDDRMALAANGQRVAQLIMPGLVTFNDESEPVGDLAESYQWLDEKTLEFTLRPGLTFHDGAPLTTADVKATYDALLTKAIPSPRADKLEPIAEVEAVDERVLRLHLKRAYAPMLAELTIGIVPRGRAREIKEQGRFPIGAGPFKFVSQPDEEHVELLPFDRYYGGKPDLTALHIRVVRDETTRVLELMKGRADLVVNGVSPAVLPSLSSEPKLRVLTRPGTGYAYVGFNVRQGPKCEAPPACLEKGTCCPIADVRVRRAICHLIRTAPIVEYKFHGLAVPATGMLPANHWAYEKTEGCTYDPKEAARLLDEAGYPDPDGPGGKPRLTISYKTSTDRFRKSIALILKEQLEQGGIGIDLRALEFGTFFSDVRKGNFEMVTLKWGAVVEPDLLRWVFSSEFIPTAKNNFGGLNRAGYSNPKVDDVLARASAAPSREERKALYGEALRQLDSDLPNVPLWHETSVAIVSNRLQGYETSAHGFFTPLAKAHEVAAGTTGGAR